MVTAFTVVHSVGNHCHKPFGKVRQPLLGVTDGNARCKIGDCALTYLYLAQHFRSINRWQSLKIFLYGIDAWRKAALDDGIKIISGSNNTFLAIKFPTKGIDVITADLTIHIGIFGRKLCSAKYSVESEVIMGGEVAFYLLVFGSLPTMLRLIFCVYIAIVCAFLHNRPKMISESEVKEDNSDSQAFSVCLHNVAQTCYKFPCGKSSDIGVFSGLNGEIKG